MAWEAETTELSEGFVSAVYDESGKLMLDGIEEWRANLIAAAPELLAALKAMVLNDPNKYRDCHSIALEAIAKAEGRS